MNMNWSSGAAKGFRLISTLLLSLALMIVVTGCSSDKAAGNSPAPHSIAATVVVHLYELVRNGEDDEHTATSDWLEVDRASGRVSSSLFD